MPAYNYDFDGSGKVKAPPAEQLKAADADTAIIAYTSGTTGDGRPYYAYLAVRPSKYREFYELSSARKEITLGDYGKIVLAGFEPAPPPDVVQHMRDKYGFDEHYERKLKEEVSRQRGQFSARQEEKRLMDIVAMMKAKKQ